MIFVPIVIYPLRAIFEGLIKLYYNKFDYQAKVQVAMIILYTVFALNQVNFYACIYVTR